MKVKELVQQLVKLPPNAEIGVQTSWNWVNTISEIITVEELVELEPTVQNLWECAFIIKP